MAEYYYSGPRSLENEVIEEQNNETSCSMLES